ncbi:MAG: DUF59 domain-containing protein [Chloroflexi bacterium]|nr:DUF59 domain-containing protein [Chloroflexota bacterium]
MSDRPNENEPQTTATPQDEAAQPQPGSNRPRWDIEETHPDKVEELIKGFRTVVDPEIGLDIITLGLVRNVRIDPEKNEALVTMILTTPFCPYGPALLEMARQKAEQVLGMPTAIEMGTEVWDMSMVEDGELLKKWGLWW